MAGLPSYIINQLTDYYAWIDKKSFGLGYIALRRLVTLLLGLQMDTNASALTW